MMKTRVVIAVALLGCCLTALAQEAAKPRAKTEKPTVASVLDRQLSILEKEFVPAAEAMPEDKYDFAPTEGEFKGVRTFAQQVKHVAATNLIVAAALLGEKPQIDPKQANGPDDIKTKDQIIKFLKDSFAQSHKAVQTITNKNVTEMVPSPFDPKDKEPRLALGNIFTWHSFDHYGQMAVYLRMNGIIPPASRK